MVRQLYKANLIEKAGETIKHVTRGGLLGAKSDVKVEKAEEGAPAPSVTPTVVGQKRKAEDQVFRHKFNRVFQRQYQLFVGISQCIFK